MKAWEEPVVLPSYLPDAPDPNPLFLEKRVYQGSSGKVYPLPVIDRIATEPVAHAWRAVHLENEYLRIMLLPEIGGRIHVGLDKRNGYDFFYRQNVIRPALVGLAGPWISGGVEFNWPQHHRPATFLPVDTLIEREADGAITVWCSDHDPMSRMKGMHGVRLRPGSAYLELRVRLYNRTMETQTFLWWANVATRVHEQYQSFFPHDVRFVADHARRAVTTFPQSLGDYYGIPYGQRAVEGVPATEAPGHFRPDGTYPANDLSWYANIPVPTSYMIANSREDFFGGWDHAAHAGLVHVANHHIAPGKKQWTWGNHEFGYAWDRCLTEEDGPYIELMAGVYTDNQPDFSYLAPGETKTFSQFWYPIRDIGVPDMASLHAAVRTEAREGGLSIHLLATTSLPGARLRLSAIGSDETIASWSGALSPERTLTLHWDVPESVGKNYVLALTQGDETLLRFAPGATVPAPAPVPATEPPEPEAVASLDELYLTGLHLEQYRHATRSPEPYWHEALRRDAGDSRVNTALGRRAYHRGAFAVAERHLRMAIARLTARNANPADSEAFYLLGLTLLAQHKAEDAYGAFYKATWSAAWRGPSYHRLAELDLRAHRPAQALDHLQRSLLADGDNLNALCLRVVLLRAMGRSAEAANALESLQTLDGLYAWTRYLANGEPPSDSGQALDVAFDCMRAGLLEDAHAVLAQETGPIAFYVRAEIALRAGRSAEGQEFAERAAKADSRLVFPSRLDEQDILESAIARNSRDACAPYLLGNLLYDRLRHEEAILLWQRATELDGSLATAWRNLGIGLFNVHGDGAGATEAFARARAAAPDDARILYEQDQLRKRLGHDPAARLRSLEAELPLVGRRDDLSLEVAALLNQLGAPGSALTLLTERHFQPWEGGEGRVLGEYTRAHLLLGRAALANGDAAAALAHFAAANTPPPSLSEARHLLANTSDIEFWLGEAHAALGQGAQAARHWERAANQRGDFQQMQVVPVSEMTVWTARALMRLGREADAKALLDEILRYADALEEEAAEGEPKIDYFATSLPTLLLFEQDLRLTHRVHAAALRASAMAGLGLSPDAALEAVRALDPAHPVLGDLSPAAAQSQQNRLHMQPPVPGGRVPESGDVA